MTSGTRKTYQAAVDRARALGGARRAQHLGNGRYRVSGRRGDEYRVAVDSRGDYSCTCPAGQQGNPCWHQGAAWLKRLAQGPVERRKLVSVYFDTGSRALREQGLSLRLRHVGDRTPCGAGRRARFDW